MKKIFFTFLTAFISCIAAQAQSLPPNTCGVVYSYDAAGNRTQRAYVCNNSGRMADPETLFTANLEKDKEELPQVDALYPNPTTGTFKVTFTRSLKEAQITLIEMNGRVVQQRIASGNQINFDVSNLPAGLYWVKIQDGKNSFVYKVIKQ